ncbi:hypothetical protein [Curtobacterium sp. MCPF17_031]|uniref:hypothetical protein n=1 Tax=Curtobacterium sp. MCPF17_031 TaxID=2175653 RepID=UPI0011B79B91|nr:hypothetical protein [Curtobacterium sp. MCPF17_031]
MQTQQIARGRGVGRRVLESVRVSQRAMFAAVAIVAVVGIAGVTVTSTPLIAVAVVALAVAMFLPKPTFAVSLFWIFLVRPGYELLHMTIGGVAVTEIDLLPVLALAAVLAMPRNAKVSGKRVTVGTVALILAMPAWLTLRFIVVPPSGLLHVSPVVDYRNITMFCVVVPIWIYINKLGFAALFRLLMACAYLACGIAILAWVLLMSHLVAPANTTLVYFHAINDVRPGGELLVLVLAVALLVKRAPLLLGNRLLSMVVVAAEFAVSQTLSMVIAAVVGFVFFTVLFRGARSTGRVLAALVVLVLFGGVAVGGVAAGSRFDLGERLGESSAQYRATEFSQLTAAVTQSPANLVLGEGPGSALAVKNVYSGVVEIKRDTHNTYGNITLKGGLIALVLFLLPFGIGLRRLLKTKNEDDLRLAASLIAVAVLTITVPFVWTAAGLSALVALLFGALQPPESPVIDTTTVASRSAALERRSPMTPVTRA